MHDKDSVEKVMLQLVQGILIARDKELPKGRIRKEVASYNAASSAPNFKKDEDVCFVSATIENSQMTRDRELHYEDSPEGLIEVATFVRQWRVMFKFYGPNSTKDALHVHDRMLTQDNLDKARRKHLFILHDNVHPMLVSEIINNEWYERADLVKSYYEEVTVHAPIDYAIEMQLQPPREG